MIYKILLKPLEPFFFGGEQTFGKFGDKESGSYIAKSRYFPNQSALLGMLRKEILKEKGFLTRKIRGEWVDSNNIKEAEKIAGNIKFCFEQNMDLNYGKVKKIYPLFMQKDDKEFIAIKDIFKYEIELNPPLIKGWKAKDDDLSLKLANIKDFKQTFSLSDIFEEIIQTGNQKLNRIGKVVKRDEKDNAFFKKISYKPKSDFRFGFYVEVDDDLELKNLDGKIVYLGADKSKFLMNIKKDEKPKDINLPKLDFDYILLLSDTYIEIPLKGNCDFAITDEISLAFTLKRRDKEKKKVSFKKSPKYYFYKRGSIIINPSDELIKHIESFKNLTQIGYNKYKRSKK